MHYWKSKKGCPDFIVRIWAACLVFRVFLIPLG